MKTDKPSQDIAEGDYRHGWLLPGVADFEYGAGSDLLGFFLGELMAPGCS